MLFTLGSTISYVLLALERRVRVDSLIFGERAGRTEADARFVHRTLKT